MSTNDLAGAAFKTNPPLSSVLTNGRTPIRQLFEGPIDIIGDVHGEYEALCQLLDNLGYDEQGHHHEGRRLVFVGDLIDRGPMNVSVVNRVRGLIEAGRTQCIIGNHELNLLRGQRKDGNGWFFGDHADDGHHAFDEILTSQRKRDDMLEFLNTLPMALERNDLRVVHACWDDASVDALRVPATPLELFHAHEKRIDDELKRIATAAVDKTDKQLIYQNRNPVKVLTSGVESRHPGFMHNGKMRYNRRMTWWNDYAAHQPFCVFGHYNRLNVPGNEAYIFDADDRPHEPLGAARNCTCIDFGGGWRPKERRAGITNRFKSRLTALRWPESILMDDLASEVSPTKRSLPANR